MLIVKKKDYDEKEYPSLNTSSNMKGNNKNTKSEVSNKKSADDE